MNIQLPKELYIYIYIISDDVTITKNLRLLCKLSYNASYDYFKIIIRRSIMIYYDTGQLFINEKKNIKDLVHYHNPISRPISFNITISNLYNSFEETKSKKVSFNY
jgi:hypothetical protein